MPNGTYKNWSRVNALVGTYRDRHGADPVAVHVSRAQWGDLRRLFTRDGFRAYCGVVPLVIHPGDITPLAVGATGELLDAREAGGYVTDVSYIPKPDRQEEDHDEALERALSEALDRMRELEATFADARAGRFRTEVQTLNQAMSGSPDLPFGWDYPPTTFAGNPFKRVPYVVFSLNPKLGPHAEWERQAHPDRDSWWQYHLNYFDCSADRLERLGKSVWWLTPFYSGLSRLIFGLEDRPLLGKPGPDELRVLGELLVNIDLFPYPTLKASFPEGVAAYDAYLDRALALGLAIAPELMIFNGVLFRALLPRSRAVITGEPVTACSGRLTITPMRIDGCKAVVLNRFLTGRHLAARSTELAGEIPAAIRSVTL